MSSRFRMASLEVCTVRRWPSVDSAFFPDLAGGADGGEAQPWLNVNEREKEREMAERER